MRIQKKREPEEKINKPVINIEGMIMLLNVVMVNLVTLVLMRSKVSYYWGIFQLLIMIMRIVFGKEI